MKFEFRGFDREGNFKVGIIDAESQEIAVNILQNQGIVVTYISRPAVSKISFIFGKISLLDLAFFCRSFKFLLKSKTSIDEIVKILSQQVNKPSFKVALENAYNDLIAGLPLSEAFSKHKNIFPETMVKMIRIGEVSGNLEEIFENLAIHFENQHKFFSKIIQSLYYPAIVLLIMLLSLTVLFFNVIPNIAKIFNENNLTLPKVTSLFINITNFLISYWYFILVGLFIFVYFLIEYFKSDEGKLFAYNFFSNIPIIGPILKEVYILSFLEYLVFLTKGGIVLSESLEIISKSIINPYYQNAIKFISDEVRKGKQVSETIKLFPDLFPPLVYQAFSTGEKTGELSNTLATLVEYYNIDLNNKTQNISELIQPIVIVLFALVLVVMELSLLIPIMELTRSVRSL